MGTILGGMASKTAGVSYHDAYWELRLTELDVAHKAADRKGDIVVAGTQS